MRISRASAQGSASATLRIGRGFAATAVVSATVFGSLVGVVVPASAASNPTPAAGARGNATTLDYSVSGTASVSVDVATGNALFTDQLITLPGATSDVPITLSYNSSVWGTSTPSAVTGTNGSGWSITGFDNRLVQNADNSVTFYGPGGLTGVFAQSGTSYTAPPEYQADLVKTGTTGWTLTDHQSQTKLTFDANGRQNKAQDRNGNTTTFNYTSGLPSSIVSSRGGTSTATLTITTTGGRITGLTQTSGSLTRTVGLYYTSNNQLESIIDTEGGETIFYNPANDDGKVVRITNPESATTTLGFTGSKVASIAQSNTAGAGTSTTRLTYPTASQTLVADPTTNQSASVASVPHTTYNLTSTGSRVASATDPLGHTRSATYTALGQVQTSTPAAGGTTTNTYGSNSGESLTSSASPGGATGTATYGNTGANAYLPSSTTSDAGNATNYTYNGAGNQLTSAQGTGPQAKVTYNSDGTPATSSSPGAAAGVQTTYSYNATTKNASGLTPVTGSSLGARAYTWDGFGRLATATDGRGNTITYNYDNLDRITKVDYSDAGTTDVTFTYDDNGQILTRTDASGTSTYTHDDLGHTLTTVNTAGGGTNTYTYDKAGNIASQTDAHGTTNYHYDDALQLEYMIYPQGGGQSQMSFAYDNEGRRTDTWLKSNGTNTTWSAHTRTTYDASGRVATVKSERGPATSPTAVIDLTYCYASGTTPAGGCTASPTTDRANIQWIKNAVNGQATKFTYNTDNRLTSSVITGGSNPRTYSYTYDTAGNRLTAVVNGTSPSSQTLTYNNANQISTSGYTYDGAGNLIAKPGSITATFNTAGQMKTRTATSGGTGNTTYTYAGTNQNELTKATTAGGDQYEFTYGIPDQNGLPVIQKVTRTSGGTAASAYVTHDNTGLPVMLQTSTGQSAMYVYDGQNNPVSLTTETSGTSYLYEFDPYGGATTAQNSGGTGYPQNPYIYGGGLQDRSTGLIKFGQRWYDPSTGAWVQQDALNAPLDPGNANRYVYASGNPINKADPTGRSVKCDIGAGTVGVLTTVSVGATGVGLGFSGLAGAGAAGATKAGCESKKKGGGLAGDMAKGGVYNVAKRGINGAIDTVLPNSGLGLP